MHPYAPPAGSSEEIARFGELQARLPNMYAKLESDPTIEHTVVVVPSLSLDRRELAKISGVSHYEERLLFFLMMLRRPRTRVVMITSQPILPTVIDYYLHLLSGVPRSHSRPRLELFSCDDASSVALSAKILARPRLIERVRRSIERSDLADMVSFNASPLERTLAVQLGIPFYGNDPALADLGSKSGCRETFREAGILMPSGFERLRDAGDIAEALAALKTSDPSLRRAVVKLNEGFSGEGNAIFRYDGIEASSSSDLERQIRVRLPELAFEAKTETWEDFERKFEDMWGVAEEFIEGDAKYSPSVQCRVTVEGQVQVVSTHDQVLGGPSGQAFMGCTFPADPIYRLDIQGCGRQVADVLATKGVLGRFAVDFVSVTQPDGSMKNYAIEINLRKGGTTHPYLTLRLLTDGTFDVETGEFFSQTGTSKYYYATDTLQDDAYVGLSADDLIDIAVRHDFHFTPTTERGVVFHLMGAVSEFGKFGLVAIGDSPMQARWYADHTTSILEREVEPSHKIEFAI